MSESRVVEHLQEIGLTEYESRTYLAAVRLGRARPVELAEESGVPQARIYDVIDDLQNRDLVEVHSQSGGKEVTAPSPKSALEDFKRRRIDEFSESVSTAADDLERFYHRTEENPDAYVTMVSRERSALRHVERAIDTAEWWLTISIDVDIYDDLRESIEAALDRNVTVRLLLSGDELAVERLDFPADLRVHYRATADMFVAADREYGIFRSQHPARSGQPYIITRERNLVLLFQHYSEQVWPASEVVQPGPRHQQRYLDPWHVIIDFGDELAEGAELYATVRGTHTETHRQGSWEGEVVAHELSGPIETDYTASTPVEASITIETDDGRVVVGGWKATFEDVAADAIEITRL